MKSLSKSLSQALNGATLGFSAWYVHGYNQAIYNGDFPPIAEIALGNFASGLLLLSAIQIIKEARRS